MEFEDQQNRRLITRTGNSVEIRPGGQSCTITIDGRIENPRSTTGFRTQDQPILRVIFVGNDLEPGVEGEGIHLFNNRKFRLLIPFRQIPGRESMYLTLRCSSVSDQFPADIRKVDRIEQAKSLLQKGNIHQYVVLSPGYRKMDLIKLKVYYPTVRVLLIREAEGDSGGEAKKEDVVRAVDLARTSETPLQLTGDPVFLARIHLRNLDLDATRQLLLDHDLTAEEIQFIRTFFQIMIQNERNDRDLMAARTELKNLDELFRLSQILMKEDRESFDQELEKGMSPRVAEYLIPVVSKIRKKAEKKDDEIYFWECEFRLSRITGQGPLK